ncbi:hypothetical protein BDZ89DRAFT_1117101 [Hymenopellis radicata]|nr:hypothetical protein BDZ89DRAFT_1117101 [Hymenopellis radicata]
MSLPGWRRGDELGEHRGRAYHEVSLFPGATASVKVTVRGKEVQYVLFVLQQEYFGSGRALIVASQKLRLIKTYNLLDLKTRTTSTPLPEDQSLLDTHPGPFSLQALQDSQEDDDGSNCVFRVAAEPGLSRSDTVPVLKTFCGALNGMSYRHPVRAS